MASNMKKRQEIELKIYSILITQHKGMSLKQLCDDYLMFNGTEIPFKELGYLNLHGFLESCSKSVRLVNHNGIYYAECIASKKSEHVSSLVRRQKSNSKPTRFSKIHSTHRATRYNRTELRIPKLTLPAPIVQEILDMIKTKPHGIDAETLLRFVRQKVPNISIYTINIVDQLNEFPHLIEFKNNIFYPVENKIENNVTSETPSKQKSSKDQYNFKRIETYEFSSSESDSSYLEPSNLLDTKTQFRLKNLLSKYPDGIWCADLPELYLQTYGVRLKFNDIGFVSVLEFAGHFPNLFHIVRSDNAGDFKLFDISMKDSITEVKAKKNDDSICLEESYLYDENIEVLPSILSHDTSQHLIPKECLRLGDSVGQLNVSNLFTETKPFIEVFVSETFTPSFFWIHMRQNRTIFSDFMAELGNYYTVNSENYQIPKSVLREGLHCVCQYDNLWHRAIIKTVDSSVEIKVLFYDFGTLKTYNYDKIFFLHKKFSLLPAQAIPCGLYNIKPKKGDNWPKYITKAFFERTDNIPLIANIHKINREENSMLVTLTDTLSSEDVHINDWLVQEGMAAYGPLRMDDFVISNNLLNYEESNLCWNEQDYAEEEDYLSKNKEVVKKTQSARKSNATTESLMVSPSSILYSDIPTTKANSSSVINNTGHGHVLTNDNSIIRYNNNHLNGMKNCMFIHYNENYTNPFYLDNIYRNSYLLPFATPLGWNSVPKMNQYHYGNTNRLKQPINLNYPNVANKFVSSFQPVPNVWQHENTAVLPNYSNNYVCTSHQNSYPINVNTTTVIDHDKTQFAKFVNFENDRSGKKSYSNNDKNFIDSPSNRKNIPVSSNLKNSEVVHSSNGSKPLLIDAYTMTDDLYDLHNKDCSKLKEETKIYEYKHLNDTNPFKEMIKSFYLHDRKEKIMFTFKAQKKPNKVNHSCSDNNQKITENEVSNVVDSSTMTTENNNSYYLKSSVNPFINKNENMPFYTDTLQLRNQILTFSLIQLSKNVIHIFFYKNEGWLSTYEFMASFTTYRSLFLLLKILDIKKINIKFEIIKRFEYPSEFSELDKSLNVPRGGNNKINELHLLPLKKTLYLLFHLNIIDRKISGKPFDMKSIVNLKVINEVKLLIETFGSSEKNSTI